MSTHNKKTNDPRHLACKAIVQVIQNQEPLREHLFQDALPETRSTAKRLARETIRHFENLENSFSAFLQKKPRPYIICYLCLGAYEISKHPEKAFALVNAYVNIAKQNRHTASASGMINAILRKVASNPVNLSHSDTFGQGVRNKLIKRYGASVVEEINQGHLEELCLDVQITPKLNLEEWALKLDATPIVNTRTLRRKEQGQVSKLAGFNDGLWWIQDVAASLATGFFDDLDGKRVLDMCAAPGGKTMQLAAKGAEVTALELSAKRAETIEKNLHRTNLEASIWVGDALEYRANPFDAILLDAPCSASGTYRRHPDLRYTAPLERLKSLLDIQTQLLNHAFKLLKPKGELIYCTCSLFIEEGERQIETFLKNHQNADLIKLSHPLCRPDLNNMGALRSLPGSAHGLPNMDGFFIAKIVKI